MRFCSIHGQHSTAEVENEIHFQKGAGARPFCLANSLHSRTMRACARHYTVGGESPTIKEIYDETRPRCCTVADVACLCSLGRWRRTSTDIQYDDEAPGGCTVSLKKHPKPADGWGKLLRASCLP